MKSGKGFTLIEMMVATSLFVMVMVVAVGALLALVETNKRAQAINVVMNNVNAAMDSITRTARVGTSYHCATSYTDISDIESPQNCTGSGGLLFAFETSNGTTDSGDQMVYRLNGTRVQRHLCSGDNSPSTCAGGSKRAGWVDLTAPGIRITSLRFFVVGSAPVPVDTIQPRALIVMRGEADVPGGVTKFSVQTTVVQRILNL